MTFLKRVAGVMALSVLFGHTAIASDFAVDASRLSHSVVRYRDPARISDFPVPVVSVRRVGLSAGANEVTEIKEKILYPLIERSRKAVSAIVLEWYPGQPNVLGISVLWSDGETRESLIPRTSEGTYQAGAYELLFAKPTP